MDRSHSRFASRVADRLVRQNFALAVIYNLGAVPVAIAGLATPLIAAVAMSSSLLLVTLNALRLRRVRAMTVLLYLMPAALFLGLLGLAGFLWALRTGQFDDLDGAAQRILIDEEILDDRSRLPNRPLPLPPAP